MRVFIFLIAAIFALAGCSKTPELHAVGIYEGHQYEYANYAKCIKLCKLDGQCSVNCNRPAWPGKTSMTVPVEIDRRGKSVTLVLVSYDPIKWEITRKSGTEINQIILGGVGRKGVTVEVNGELYDAPVRRSDIPYVNQARGEKFRSLVKEVPDSLGFDRFDSFQGNYNAPESGFRVAEVQPNNEVLDPDYLRHKIQPIDPDINLSLSGTVGGVDGEFLPDGTFVKTLPMTPQFNLAVSADYKTGYLYSNKGIRKIIADESGQDEGYTIPLPKKNGGPNRNLGHFIAITLDEKRNRLLAMFQAGAANSVIMAFDFERYEWSEFGSTGRNQPTSFFYDAEEDRFLVTVGHFSAGLSIGSLDPNSGKYQTLREISSSTFQGLTDLYDVGNRSPPDMYIAGMEGQHLALVTYGTYIFSRPRTADAAKTFRRIYTLDMKTGEVKLTYYDD